MSKTPHSKTPLLWGFVIAGFAILLLWNVVLTVTSHQRHQALSEELVSLKAGVESELVLALVDPDGKTTAEIVRTPPDVSVVSTTPVATTSTGSATPAPPPGSSVKPAVDPADDILGTFEPPPATASRTEPLPSIGDIGKGRGQDLIETPPLSLFDLRISTVQRNRIVGLDGGSKSGVKRGMFFTIADNSGPIAKLEIQSVSDTASVGLVSGLNPDKSISVGNRVVPGN